MRRNQKRKLRLLRRRRVWGLWAEPLGLWLIDTRSWRPLLFTYADASAHFSPYELSIRKRLRGWKVRLVPARQREPRVMGVV